MKRILLAIALAAVTNIGYAAQDKAKPATSAQSCPCSGTKYCVGPRGGHYCITSSGTKRYAKR
jgi:hypothetical protein